MEEMPYEMHRIVGTTLRTQVYYRDERTGEVSWLDTDVEMADPAGMPLFVHAHEHVSGFGYVLLLADGREYRISTTLDELHREVDRMKARLGVWLDDDDELL